jgi:predicted acetyltransferase
VIAKGRDFERIENMMQFYMHDFSEWIALSIGDNGFFTITPKAEYFANPKTKAYLVTVDGETAGFVTLDNDVNHPDATYNMGYFFIGRRFRGKGIGKEVVAKVLNSSPGVWQIYHITANLGAAAFWKNVIPSLVGEKFSLHSEYIYDFECTLYKFTSSPAVQEPTSSAVFLNG